MSNMPTPFEDRTLSEDSSETKIEDYNLAMASKEHSLVTENPPIENTSTSASASMKDLEKLEPATQDKPPDADPNLVTWNGPNDPRNPHNWRTRRKVFITGIWVVGNMVTTIASSVFSSGSSAIAAEFNVSSTVTTLGVSLFLLVRSKPHFSPVSWPS